MRVRAGVDEVDAERVALGRAEHGAGDGAVVRPRGEEDAGSDLDLLVDGRERVLADAARLVGQSLGRVEQRVEVVRAADCRCPFADHRGVAHRGVLGGRVARVIAVGRLGRRIERVARGEGSRRERGGRSEKAATGEMMFSHY